MQFQISEGLEKKYITDALKLSYAAFADKFWVGIKTDADFVALLTDAIQPGNCLTATTGDKLAGILTFQTTERSFYDITFRDFHAKRKLFPSLLIYLNCAFFHTRVDGDEFYVDSLVVAPDFRRHGIASKLLESIETGARIQGKDRISLHVLEKNSAAQRLYEKHGFRITRSFPGFFISGSPKILRLEKRTV